MITSCFRVGLKTQFRGHIKRFISLLLTAALILGMVPVPSWAAGQTWNYRSPLPTANYMQNVKYIGGKYMAVGYNGTLITSTDGVNWQKVKVGSDTDRLTGIAYGNNKYVIVGTASDYAARIYTSDDGLSWRETAAIAHHWLHDVTYGDNGFVAVGQSGKILLSGDGENWVTKTVSDMDYTLLSVTFADGKYVAAGMGATTADPKGGIMVSNDGENWTVTHFSSYTLWDITYGGGVFVVVGGNTDQWGGFYICTSPEGTTWTNRSVPDAPTSIARFYSVDYDGSRFIAAGAATPNWTNKAFVAASGDGINWTYKGDEGKPSFSAVASNASGSGSQYVAMGGYGNIYTSDDGGTSWTSRTLGTTKTLMDAAWNGSNLFVAVGREGTIQTSPDGVTWTIQTSGTTYDLNKVAYLNGQFIAVGKNGTILTSANGTSWTSINSGTTAELQDIAFGEGVYVAGGNGVVRISSDGINWSAPTGLTDLRAVAYGNGDFVALSQYGTAYNSADGVTWTQCGSLDQFSKYPRDMIYAGGKFAAVGGNGEIFLSSDNGSTWTVIRSDVAVYLQSIAYGGGNFAAVAQNGRGIMASADGGVTWFMQPSGLTPNPYFSLYEDAELYGIVAGGDSFVAVGGNGVVLQSGSFGINTDPDVHDVAIAKTNLDFNDISGPGSNSNAGSIVVNMNLITSGDKGTTISWTSSKPEYIAADGTVTRPPIGAGNQVVYLTATITKETASDTKSFIVVVIEHTQSSADAQAVATDKAALTWDSIKGTNSTESSITSNLVNPLPTTGSNGTSITWSAAPTDWIDTTTGEVTRPTFSEGDKQVTLTATITKGASSATKVFYLTVKALEDTMTDAEAVAADKAALTWDSIKGTNSTESSIASNLVNPLPTAGSNGTSISWSADPTGWINTTTGAVTRPSQSQGDKTVTLTASITKGDASSTKAFTLTIKALSDGGSGGSDTPSVPVTTINALVEAGTSYKANYPLRIDWVKGSATVSLNTDALNAAFETAGAGNGGVSTVSVRVPAIYGVNLYMLEIPVSALVSENPDRIIEISSEAGTIKLQNNMLHGLGLESSGNVSISIGKASKESLPQNVREAVGNRPVIELNLTSGNKTITWNNPDAPVTVSIPYTPTADELANPEHITVWYIDGAGNLKAVPSGRYDPATGMVVFTTTHFSKYSVAFVQKTFDDLVNVQWAKKQIEVLASKGILREASEAKYAPKTNITRADFLYSLVRALGVDAKVDDNFADVSSDAYYYREIAIARKLGITNGTGNNKFSPDAFITRQDMMILAERALRMHKKLQEQGTASDLVKFADRFLIAPYAVNSVATLVREELIVGSGNGVNPLGNTTRAEAAVFLYRIYNKY